MTVSGKDHVGSSERAVLKELALAGGLAGEFKTSCKALGKQLDVSTQTASRRLQRLEAADFITRETVSDGQWITITDPGKQVLQEEYQEYQQLFETDPEITLVGRVESGMGEGRHYISKAGYMDQFRNRLGYEPFAGTLNIRLDAESTRRRTALEAIEGIPIDGWEGETRTFGPAICYSTTIEHDGEEIDQSHLIVPERTHHDESRIELIAAVKLREQLELTDGDQVEITVTSA